MSALSASAPGKVILSGEYAVLDGAPAVAAAVTARARVTVVDGENSFHTVTSTGSNEARGEFRNFGDDIEWLAGDSTFGIVAHAWRASGVAAANPLAMEIDTREFYDHSGQRKLGLGSSAALMAALVAALGGPGSARTDVTRAALAAHRDFQQGAGSGVDVVCSVAGGLLSYCMADAGPTSLQWPKGLVAAFYWSGVPASTTAKLHSLSQQAPAPSRVALGAAAQQAAAAWSSGDAAGVLAAMRAYTERLQRFSVDHDLGIFDAGHAALARDAGDSVVYKPCGAGGGDVGVALAASNAALDEFTDRAVAADFERLNIEIDPQGYDVTRADD